MSRGQVFYGPAQIRLLRERIAELEAACAAYREALEKARRYMRDDGFDAVATDAMDEALASDAGKAVLERLRIAEGWAQTIRAARADEREACAKAVEALPEYDAHRNGFDDLVTRTEAAEAIRARGG